MKCNFEAFGQVNEKTIQEFEREIGYRLPNDYREFLRKFNGGFINTEEYCDYCFYHPERGYWSSWVKELNSYMSMEVLYGIDLEENNIQKENAEYGEDLPAGMLYIGHPRAGGFFIIDSRENGSIYFHASSYLFSMRKVKTTDFSQ